MPDGAALATGTGTKSVMGTVDRALRLLRHFTVDSPELRLSELARLAGYDKTTTLRLMTSLQRNGFVELHPESKRYRLGVAPIYLARVREQSFPLQTLLQPILDRLAEEFGETAHASLLSGGALMNVATAEPHRAARVYVDPSTPLPIHASASGLAVLAFTAPKARAALGLTGSLERFTEYTPRNKAELAVTLEQIAGQGFSHADRSYDIDVIGTAVPIFGWSGAPIGAIAVATVASRYTDALGRGIVEALMSAGHRVSSQLIGPAGSGEKSRRD